MLLGNKKQYGQLAVWFLLAILLIATPDALGDTPCVWKSNGATYDLRPLTVTQQDAKSYYILDGDIPCTPETEPAFSYTWNFCAPVTAASVPGACSNMGKMGVALQYLPEGKGSNFLVSVSSPTSSR